MNGLARVIVGLLALVGALALVLVVAAIVGLRTAEPVQLGTPTPAPQATRSGEAEPLVAQTLTAEVTVPFETLAAQAGPGVQLSDAGEGRIRVSLPVQALGQEFRAIADGDLSVDGGDVIVHPRTVRVEGLPVLDGVVSALAQQAAGIRTTMTGIPRGVRVESATSTPQGVRAKVTGRDVPLPAP